MPPDARPISPADQSRPIARLVAVVAGAVCLTLISGVLMYLSTRRLISATDWVDHTEQVLLAVQSAYQLTERIDYDIHRSATDPDQLNNAMSTSERLDVAIVHLKAMVVDNAAHLPDIQALSASAASLNNALSSLTAGSAQESSGASRNQAAAAVRECRHRLNLMSEQERRLLEARNDEADQTSLISYVTEGVFVALSLLTLLGLFSYFLRDAHRRRQAGGEMERANENLARSIEALRDQAQESELLTFARNELQLCLNLGQVYTSAARSFALLLPGSSGALCMINNSRNLIEKTCSWGTAAIEDLHPPQACCGLRSGHPRWRVKNESEIHCGHFADPGGPDCYLCVPVAAHGETQGMLYVECTSDAVRYTVERRMDGLRQLLQLTGMTVASLNLRTKLENQSIRDPLTNLFNRHFMQVALERELARAERRECVLAILMLDVDHFKSFNDTWGHAAGDTVLKDVAEVLKASVREEDIVCRYGGEEFMIILTDISPEDAWERAEGLRRAVGNLRVPLDKDVVAEVTVSIGVALYPTDGQHAEVLVQKADKALYRAKREGRNRVLLAELTQMA